MSWVEYLSEATWFSAMLVVVAVSLLSLTGTASALMLRSRPALRHTLLLSALVGCLACPLVAVVVVVTGSPLVTLEFATTSPQPLSETAGELEKRQADVPPMVLSPVTPVEEFGGEVAAATSNRSSDRRQADTAAAMTTNHHRSWSPFHWIILFWTCGSLVCLIGTIRGIVRANRVSRDAHAIVSDSIVAVAGDAARQVGLARPPRLLASTEIRSPAVVGCWRMSVILPPELFAIISHDELRSVLIHEFAHVCRRDPPVVLLQSVARCLFWPILSIHWLDRQLSRAREEVCDNYVLRQTTSLDYGQTLLKLGQLALGGKPLAASVGMLNWRGKLEDRIAGFLNADRSPETKTSRIGSAAVLMLMLLFATSVCGARLVQAIDQPPAAEKENEKEKGSAVATAATEIDPAVTRYLDATIVDHQGDAVAGAKVELWALSYASGGRGVHKAYTQPLTTDEEGRVRIAYPVAADKAGKLLTKQLALRVNHRDFPPWSSYVAVDLRAPIRLPEPTWATIAASLPGGIPIASDLYAVTSGLNPTSTMVGPTLRIGPIDLFSRQPSNNLRVVHAPENGPAFFSELIDLTQLDRKEGEIHLSLELQPAATVVGKLSEDVPRPVKNGVVLATIIHSRASPWQWAAKTAIGDDGTFVIHGIPHDEHLQLIATCDGWISLPPRPSEVTEYSELFGYEVAHNHGAGTGRVTPQLHYVSAGTSETTIAMHHAGAAKVRVVDWDNKPIVGAQVAFAPNQAFHNGGSQILGEGASSLEHLRILRLPNLQRQAALRQARSAIQNPYQGVTDKQGIATIKNLPSHLSWHDNEGKDHPGGRFLGFHVSRQGYRLVPQEPQRIFSSSGQPRETIDMIPGETASIRVRMERIDQPPATGRTAAVHAKGAAPKNATADRPKPGSAKQETVDITVTGTATNLQGQPVARAKVHLLSVGEKDGKLAETTTDNQGRYQFNDVALPVRRSETFIDGGVIQIFAMAESYGICWHGKRSVLLVPRPENDSRSELSTRFYQGEPIVMDLQFLPASKLHGKVVDDHGKPVVGASIDLGMLDFIDHEGRVYHKNYREFWGMRFAPKKYQSTKTDAQGNFEIGGLPDNTACRVSISHDKYARQSLYAAITGRKIGQYTYSTTSTTGIAGGKVVRYPNYETRKVETSPLQIEVVANQTATIDVVDKDGVSLPDVSVFATSGGRATGTFASGKTDQNGSVELALPPGQYQLVVRPSRETAFVTTYGELAVPQDGQRKKVRLVSGCMLVLKAVDAETGKPIAGMNFWKDVENKPGARTGLNSTPMYVDHPVTNEEGIMRAVVKPGKRTIGVGWSNVPKPYQGGGGGRAVECAEGETVSLTFEVRKNRQ